MRIKSASVGIHKIHFKKFKITVVDSIRRFDGTTLLGIGLVAVYRYGETSFSNILFTEHSIAFKEVEINMDVFMA